MLRSVYFLRFHSSAFIEFFPLCVCVQFCSLEHVILVMSSSEIQVCITPFVCVCVEVNVAEMVVAVLVDNNL